MANRWQNNSHTRHRVPTYYARNKIYPDANAPTYVPGRTSRRIHDGFSLDRNFGLDTTSDDVNQSIYSSPYYINGRYNSDNLTTQRANSASVQGTKALLVFKEERKDFDKKDIQTYLTMWQGKQIKFELPFDGKIIGNTITIRNTDGCTGILSIYLSAKDGGKPFYETAIDLCEVSQDVFEHRVLYSNSVFKQSYAPNGKVYVRLEIWDEVDQKRSANPFNTGRKIEIASTGEGSHYSCVYRIQDKNTCVKEKYEYEIHPNRPLLGLIYSDYHSIPTVLNGDEKIGATVSLNGYRYDIFAIQDGSHTEAVIYDRIMNRIIDNDIRIDGRAKKFSIVQAKDYVYYVDGYSPLQKFKVGEWKSEALPISTSKDDTQPVIGANLIVFHNNRIYLAGFRTDPNLMQASTIEEDGADFDNYVLRWYVPGDNYPEALSINPITAVVEYSTNEFLVVGDHFCNRFQSNADIDNSYPASVSMITDINGVADEGDITSYRGTIYAFSPEAGLQQFNGSIWRQVSGSSSIDSHFDRVDMDSPRKLWGYANKLYFNYTDKVDRLKKCLVWDMKMNYQQYPWFQDIELPFCDVRVDHDFGLIGIHPDYPCIMELYAEDTWRRLDSPITFERHTKHIQLPGNASDIIVNRVHNKVIANSNRWWWFGLSSDKHELTQYRGKDSWFRLPVWDTISVDEPQEFPFPDNEAFELDAVQRLTISNLRIRCMSIQEKIKCKTFRSQASLISTVFEVTPRQYN